mgnify:FL=1
MKKSSKKPVAVLLCAAAAILVGLVAYDGVKQNCEFSSSSAMMNTAVSADIEGKDAKMAGKEVFACISELENKLLSRHIGTSAVSEINDAAGQSVRVTLFSSSADGVINDPEKKLEDILERCEELRKISGGAFNPLLGGLSDLWGFGTENERVPEKAEISAALNGTDSAVEINENGIKIPSGTVLDLGSVGKGIACDEVRGVLEKAKIKRAVVSVGGSILLYGDGEKFTVGIRDPFSESSAESFARLTLPACCVSTSGSYERYFEHGGVRYHHILDPKTGYPAESGLVSVTVVCDNGFLSDALSTACFVLGYEKSLPLLEKYGARAVFVFNDKSVRVTGSLADSFELEKDGFKLL